MNKIKNLLETSTKSNKLFKISRTEVLKHFEDLVSTNLIKAPKEFDKYPIEQKNTNIYVNNEVNNIYNTFELGVTYGKLL